MYTILILITTCAVFRILLTLFLLVEMSKEDTPAMTLYYHILSLNQDQVQYLTLNKMKTKNHHYIQSIDPNDIQGIILSPMDDATLEATHPHVNTPQAVLAKVGTTK